MSRVREGVASLKRTRRTGDQKVLAVLLGIVLAVHFVTRFATHLGIDSEAKSFWPSSYLVSLSLVAGAGFNYLLPKGSSPYATASSHVVWLRDAPGVVGDIMDFLSGTGRQSLSRQDLERYVANGAQPVPLSAPEGGPPGSRWEITRVLDLYVAAALWRVFGISWIVLFAFYALASTLSAFLLFRLVESLTDSSWGGLIAAVVLLASPFERIAGAWSFRDANPLWFATLAFCLLLRFAKPNRSRGRTWLGWFAIGAGTVLGFGWRPDAQLLPLFVIPGLLLLVWGRGAGVRRAGTATLFSVGGALSTIAVIGALGPAGARYGGGIVFHIAWYGEHVRSDVLGTENVFQIKQDDFLTLYQSNYARWHEGRGEPATDLYDPRHLATVRSMYSRLARYDAHAWWIRFPSFLWNMAHVDRLVLPGPFPEGRPIVDAVSVTGPVRAVNRLNRWAGDVWTAGLPWLATLGVIFGFVVRTARLPTILLLGFFVYYAAALLLVLPESKHWMTLLLPLHALAAAGLYYVLSGLGNLRTLPSFGAALRPLLVAVVATLVLWRALGYLTSEVSRRERQRLTTAILASVEGPEAPVLARVFETNAEPSADPTVGYLLTVRGAARPVDLYCAHLRDGLSSGATPLYYFTRHRLERRRDQLFFVSAVSGYRVGDLRPYQVVVRVRGSAQIVSVRKVDTSRDPLLGIPLSILFEPHDDKPGSDLVAEHHRLPVTGEFWTREEAESFLRP